MANIKIDFNVDMLDLNDDRLEDCHETLSFFCAISDDKRNRHKIWGWVGCLRGDGILKLDKPDIAILRSFIDNSDMKNYQTGQLTDIIDAAVAKSEKAEKAKLDKDPKVADA